MNSSCSKNNQRLPKSSDICTKSPYLENNLLRVDGRIDKAGIETEHKRPIIMPKNGHATVLLLMNYHKKFHHMNHETAINELRQCFYIPRPCTLYKSTIRRCQMCKIRKAMPQTPQMAKLPKARLSA